MRVPNVMEVGAQVPAKTIPEFVAYARANPGKVCYASPGTGTSVMMSAELFKILAKVPLVAVTCRGMNAGGHTDMMSGRVQVAFDNLPGSIGYIRNREFQRWASPRRHERSNCRTRRARRHDAAGQPCGFRQVRR